MKGPEPPENFRHVRRIAQLLIQLAGPQVHGADIRRRVALGRDQRHPKSELQGELLPGALRRVRQLREQLQAPPRERDGTPIVKSADVVLRSLLKVLYGPLVVTSPLKVHCKLGRDLPGTFAVELFHLVPDS